MKHSYFSETMKMVDLALANCRLLYVFPRFGIEFGLGDATVKQMCGEKGISADLFLLVCNIYTFENYIPDTNALPSIPMAELMQYLQASHRDYLQNRMSGIISQIQEMKNCCHKKHGEMLGWFCEKYRQELIEHFKYEEETVFPYIRALLQGEKAGNYNIGKYEKHHEDLDAALIDLKNIMLKYMPTECAVEKYRNVLIDLFSFGLDLNRHTCLENQILISLVESIEKNIKRAQ